MTKGPLLKFGPLGSLFILALLFWAPGSAYAGLVQHLRFEGGLADSAGSYSAVSSGTVAYPGGAEGWEGDSAVQWSAPGSRAWVQADATLNSADFTQMFWLYLPAGGPGADAYLGDAGNFPVWLSAAWSFSLWSWTPTNGYLSTGYTPPRDNWVHLAWIYDRAASRLILLANGREVYRGEGVVIDRAGAAWHFLASNAYGGDTLGAFGGKMDDYRLYDEALDAAQVQELIYPGGLVLHLPLDENLSDAAYAHDFLASDDASITSQSRFGAGALRFANYAGHAWTLRRWQELAGTEFTLAFWLNVPSDELNYGAARIFSMTGFGFEIAHYGDEHVAFYNDDTHGADWSQTHFVPERDRWYHLAWSCGPTTLTLFVDGNPVWNRALSTAVDLSDNEWMNLGAVGDGTPEGLENFNGILDDLRLYNRALDAQGVASIHPADKAARPSPWHQTCQVDSATTLTWAPGAFAQSHRVYLSDSLPLGESDLLAEQPGDTLALTGLTDGTDYFWRVDSVNAAGQVTTGDTWEFQVRAGASTRDWEVMPDTWEAVDDLGRRVPTHGQTGPPRADRFSGIFYFTWLGKHGRSGPHDLTQIIAQNPSDPPFGPENAFHHWGESQFGYYLSDDEYVIRKHAQELQNAGIDTLILDVTNSYSYPSNYLKICRVLQDMRDEGTPTPQVCFFAYNGDYTATVRGIYDTLYARGLYPDLWFHWQGKPLLLSPLTGLDPQLQDFFTIRTSWAFSDWAWFGLGQRKWPWLDDYPQSYGWDTDPSKPEEMAVAVASHPTRNRGRSYSNYSQPAIDQYGLTGFEHLGLFFDEQWSRVHAIEPDFVFITGWNEWVAQRFIDPNGGDPFLGRSLQPGESFFVDAYNQEYNRDIEPMRGGHSDNYYYQMLNHLRRHKGAGPQPVAEHDYSIDIDGDFADWQEVAPEYRDYRGDAIDRDHAGWGQAGWYRNEHARNDIEAVKVARSVDSLSFYLRTVQPLSDPSGENWMLVLIDADRNPATGWLGYDFILNRMGKNAQTTRLEAHAGGGWNWSTVAEVSWATGRWELEIEIPLTLLGANAMEDFEFKVSDNMREEEIADDAERPAQFRLNGDAAPDLRFNYRFIFEPKAGAGEWSRF